MLFSTIIKGNEREKDVVFQCYTLFFFLKQDGDAESLSTAKRFIYLFF